MAHKITVLADHAPHGVPPRWDILPVAKLTCTGEGITQPIFTQAVLCYRPGDGLHIRMWAFETAHALSPNSSVLTAAFAPNPDRTKDFIVVRFSQDGITDAYTVTRGAAPAAVDWDGLTFSLFSGEDLQGEYWGGTFMLPQGLLKARFGITNYLGGECVGGNLHHASKSSGNAEFSTLYPITGTDINTPSCFGGFELIAY